MGHLQVLLPMHGRRAFPTALRDLQSDDFVLKGAFRKALETVKFDTVRGKFKFNTNHYPIQDFYLTEIAKDGKGRPVMELKGLIAADYADAYAKDCTMPAAN